MDQTNRPVIRNRKLDDPSLVWDHNSWYHINDYDAFFLI
jgi:hypothetical protein